MAASGKEQYFIYVPDTPTADRARVRPLHMAQLAHAPASHTVFMGGAVLGSQPSSQPPSTSPGDFSLPPMDFKGSAMILEFDTVDDETLEKKKEKVVEYLKGDPYVEEGVWDLERVEIWPFKTGFSGVEVLPR